MELDFDIANPTLFQMACDLIQGGDYFQSGIGSLGEKSLHATIKNYLDPYGENQEIKVGRHVADIVCQQGIVEIQTRNFHSLKGKLAAFLPADHVCVVYPVAARKSLYWLNPTTGESQLSPRAGKPDCGLSIFYELPYILPFLSHPNLHFCLLFLQVDEVRAMAGAQGDQKRHSTRVERIPRALINQRYFSCAAQLAGLLPDSLPDPFTAKDVAKHGRVSPRVAGTAVKLLTDLGALSKEKVGRSFFYTTVQNK